ncbi:hypothetical protein GGI15_004466 [Coemansia interrupta]|uniref:Uncharacterized protein n=1 Tax=Coemansia interrupta TaxID=1126814 RepID=A0A9W8LDW1_9FUNG|nr:hypothetical protein GGI15_004466 [Coemansia interrupta]
MKDNLQQCLDWHEAWVRSGKNRSSITRTIHAIPLNSSFRSPTMALLNLSTPVDRILHVDVPAATPVAQPASSRPAQSNPPPQSTNAVPVLSLDTDDEDDDFQDSKHAYPKSNRSTLQRSSSYQPPPRIPPARPQPRVRSDLESNAETAVDDDEMLQAIEIPDDIDIDIDSLMKPAAVVADELPDIYDLDGIDDLDVDGAVDIHIDTPPRSAISAPPSNHQPQPKTAFVNHASGQEIEAIDLCSDDDFLDEMDIAQLENDFESAHNRSNSPKRPNSQDQYQQQQQQQQQQGNYQNQDLAPSKRMRIGEYPDTYPGNVSSISTAQTTSS